jgi:hypothetical protein
VGALAAAIVLLAGCASPFQAHVDPSVLRSELPWSEERKAPESDGWLGATTVETLYTFDPASNGPPFPGLLQVFSAKGVTHDREELLRVARDAVEAAMEAQNLQPIADGRHEGRRALQSGLETSWFTMEATATESGALFSQSVRVRILGEAAFDGLSSTSVVLVGLAQVAATPSCPTILQCPPDNDLRTWGSLAGDPEGSPAWDRNDRGLVDHLVTHG